MRAIVSAPDFLDGNYLSTEARVPVTLLDLHLAHELADRNPMGPAKAGVETARAQLRAANAQIGTAKAAINTAKGQVENAQAAVRTAQLNLGFTRIISPIDGIAGRAQVQVGNLVNSNSAVITTVSTLDPIKDRAAIVEADQAVVVQAERVGFDRVPH